MPPRTAASVTILVVLASQALLSLSAAVAPSRLRRAQQVMAANPSASSASIVWWSSLSEDSLVRAWDGIMDGRPFMSGDGASVYVVENGGKGIRCLGAVDGQIKWQADWGGMVWDLLVSPSQGTIFVKTDDRVMDKVSAVDGSSGKTLWGYSTQDKAVIYSNLAVSPDGTRLFFAADADKGGAVHALDTATGTEAWSAQPSTLGTASYPRQLLCTPDGGRLVGVGEGGEVYAINPSDGTLQWSNRVATCFSFRHPCPEPVLSLDGTTLFITGGNDTTNFFVQALNTEDGSWRWNATMPASFQDMAPFQHGSTLYVIQEDLTESSFIGTIDLDQGAEVDTPLSNFRFRGSQALQVIPDLDRNKIYLLGTAALTVLDSSTGAATAFTTAADAKGGALTPLPHAGVLAVEPSGQPYIYLGDGAAGTIVKIQAP